MAGRTLFQNGATKVEIPAQSVNSTTHSYTMQPLISCDGRLVGPLLIVLPEKNGEFGPRVKETSPTRQCSGGCIEIWKVHLGDYAKMVLLLFKTKFSPNLQVVFSWKL